jgi:hypothetical protein
VTDTVVNVWEDPKSVVKAVKAGKPTVVSVGWYSLRTAASCGLIFCLFIYSIRYLDKQAPTCTSSNCTVNCTLSWFLRGLDPAAHSLLGLPT